MKHTVALVVAVWALFAASPCRADLIVVAVDALRPPEAFSKTFDVSVACDRGSCRLTVAYASQPEQLVRVTYADGEKLEYYAEGVVERATVVLLGDGGRRSMEAPVRLSKTRGGRSSATLAVEEALLGRLRFELYVRKPTGMLCYEITFARPEGRGAVPGR